MAELMIAARGFSTAKSLTGNSMFRGSSYHGGTTNSTSFMNGGLAGAVGRRFGQSAASTMTGQKHNPVSRMAFEASLKKGGEFANNVTGAVAQGNISYTGSMVGKQAAQALTSYLGQNDMTDAPNIIFYFFSTISGTASVFASVFTSAFFASVTLGVT